MEIPLWILLIPFGLIIACTTLFLFFNIFHLKRYGITQHGATPLIFTYLISYAVVIIVGTTVLSSINWSQRIHLSDVLPFASKTGTSFGL